MTNPRLFTLSEIITICQIEKQPEQLEYAKRLLLFLEHRQQLLAYYQVTREREQIKQARESQVRPRRCQSLDAEQIECCILTDV